MSGDDATGTDAGSIRVISGINGAPYWTFFGDAAGDSLANLTRLADVNGDGEPELVVGAWDVDANGVNSGALTIYLSNGRRPGKFSTYGAGCLGASGTMPRIGAANRPVVGQTFTVTHRTAAPTASSALHLGTAPQAIDLGLIGFTGCTALTLPTFVFPGTTDAVGRGSRALPIPNRASMIDASLYGQWYFLELPAAVLSTSNGGKITFGGS